MFFYMIYWQYFPLNIEWHFNFTPYYLPFLLGCNFLKHLALCLRFLCVKCLSSCLHIVGTVKNINIWWCNGYGIILKGLPHFQRSKLKEGESFFLVKSKKLWTHPKVTNSDQTGRNSSLPWVPNFLIYPKGPTFPLRTMLKKRKGKHQALCYAYRRDLLMAWRWKHHVDLESE